MGTLIDSPMRIPAGDVLLEGDLFIPEAATGIIVFSHGSGSSRYSPRNLMAAQYLQGKGFGTLLFDLLTKEEGFAMDNRFFIPLLGDRLVQATEWLHRFTAPRQLRIGYFGASTGAAVAFTAAARLPEVAAVVSHGGRPDLALAQVKAVKAPTRLIVGTRDPLVISYNQEAYNELTCKKSLVMVESATHLFEEKGALEQVCSLAREWFEENLKCNNPK